MSKTVHERFQEYEKFGCKLGNDRWPMHSVLDQSDPNSPIHSYYFPYIALHQDTTNVGDLLESDDLLSLCLLQRLLSVVRSVMSGFESLDGFAERYGEGPASFFRIMIEALDVSVVDGNFVELIDEVAVFLAAWVAWHRSNMPIPTDLDLRTSPLWSDTTYEVDGSLHPTEAQ
jgi:hypothetical protein